MEVEEDEESIKSPVCFAGKETEKGLIFLSADDKQESSSDSDYDTDLDAEGKL